MGNGFNNPKEEWSWKKSVEIIEQLGVKTDRNVSRIVLGGDKLINYFGNLEGVRSCMLTSRVGERCF